ncbi:hypothetical protein DFH27DRAFT_476464 [Peziza echinospora]|nr:hypothetical protein DFH27DRAFT_476464 [Peziza echinospora]
MRGFGSQLTTDEPASSALRPDAQPFQPGQTQLDKEPSDSDTENLDVEPISVAAVSIQARSVKTVKEAEDLMSRIHQGMASGAYECMICYGGVTRKSQIWDCGRCYAVFHLKCIHKWAKQGLDAPLPPGVPQNGEEKRTWRCPGCQNTSEELPNKYECWCGKSENPDVQRYIAPHSCGQTCDKQRVTPRACPHKCDLPCHAGPCPPCTAMGPVQACYCGKESTQRRCLDTDYENGWSCQQICEDYMPCGDHTCPKPCHPGMCGDCEFEEDLKCYCGKVCKGVKCFEKGSPIKSIAPTETGTEEWVGHWSCKIKCERLFDCGIHSCQKSCHPIDPEPAHCPLSPDKVTNCPCGKTKVADILETPRQSCEDPIPSCSKPCNKILKCGHKCLETCHIGDCGVCLQNVAITCRCGRTPVTSICHQGELYEPAQCRRTCKVILNCQRHECGEKCCSGEIPAMERIAAAKKKKSRPLDSTQRRTEESYEPEHICTRPCGKLLKCGTHTCPMLCHRGPCGTCLEASFDELACHCRRTVIQPPVPCGSIPPVCTHQCTRPMGCPHPRVPHNCHGDGESCPKCPYLTVKRCVCGKKDIKNQPCWRDAVTCATVCGKKLSCGSHTCKKICHKPGECEEPCTQPCGKPKTCDHLCTDPCHAPFQCAENTPCQSKVQVSCPCGGIKQEVKCNATKNTPGLKSKEIKCNDSCRARRMALALEIDPDRDSTLLGYSDETIKCYNENTKLFTQSVEKALRTFAEGPSKRYAFPPMKSIQREFIHNLADDYGFESESQDPEPYRSVVVMKGPKIITVPKKSIAQFIQSAAKASNTPVPASNVAAVEQLRKPGKQASNAIVLQGLRVGLLVTDLERELEVVLKASPLRFNIHWSGEEVILEPKPSSLGMDEIEVELSNIKPTIKRTFATKGIAQDVELCWIGRDGKVVQKEGQKWAVVAGNNNKSSGSSTPTPAWGRPGITIAQNGFGALDSFSSAGPGKMLTLGLSRSADSLREREKKEKEKKLKEKVVDNWEEAADEEIGPDSPTKEGVTVEASSSARPGSSASFSDAAAFAGSSGNISEDAREDVKADSAAEE